MTFSVSVMPVNAAGTVQFKDNGTAIGSPVAVAAGQASVQHTFCAAGSHSITAEFSGGPGFASSAAAAQTVTVADPDVENSLSVFCSWFRDDSCFGGPGGDGEPVDCG
ncbi:hypothetical protein GS498_13235, partial [Rhodococcus hoagii]|nr:hypothetical protein [Prescottella equi]